MNALVWIVIAFLILILSLAIGFVIYVRFALLAMASEPDRWERGYV